MRVLVCGSREWTDYEIVETVLDGYFREEFGAGALVIEGGAAGADRCARAYCGLADVEHLTFPADWEKHGKAAGPIRNQRMLDEGKPDVVIAFKDGFQRDQRGASSNWLAPGGTEDLVRRAKAAGIPVYVVSHG